MQTLDPSIFRAYDIRGIVDQTLTQETVFLIGKALGSLVKDKGDNQLAIGRDGRFSGPMLSKALSDGILSVGCDVIDIGLVPTPLLYYATQQLKIGSGVMLTGSHNPPEYNGLKIVMGGVAVAEEGITRIYERILKKDFYAGQGKRTEIDVAAQYIKDVTDNIQLSRPLKIVVDAGNGAAGEIAPRLFRALGCEVHELFCEIDGSFPNHHPDPTQIENLQDLISSVKSLQADVGLAFDGDGDRLGVVTNVGEIIFPDRLLMLFATALLSVQPNATIIYDVKCSDHLDSLIRMQKGIPLMWKTGHSLIKVKMAEINAQLAGEMSGHFFFRDRWNGFDDALYAGARLLETLSQHPETSHEVFGKIPKSVNTPELKVLVADEEKFELMQKLTAQAQFEDVKEIITIDGLRISFNDGWGLVRPSNTTPCLILRFEAINEAMLAKIQQLFKDWMLSVKPDLVLPF